MGRPCLSGSSCESVKHTLGQTMQSSTLATTFQLEALVQDVLGVLAHARASTTSSDLTLRDTTVRGPVRGAGWMRRLSISLRSR